MTAELHYRIFVESLSVVCRLIIKPSVVFGFIDCYSYRWPCRCFKGSGFLLDVVASFSILVFPLSICFLRASSLFFLLVSIDLFLIGFSYNLLHLRFMQEVRVNLVSFWCARILIELLSKPLLPACFCFDHAFLFSLAAYSSAPSS